MQQAQARTTPLEEESASVAPRQAGNARPALDAPLFNFLALLGRTPLGEIWKAETCDGRVKVVHFVENGAALLLGENIDRLLALSHAAVPRWQWALANSGQRALVSDFHANSLRDRFQQSWQGGQPGVPQAEVLGCMRAVAEALDHICSKHRIQHLALTPDNLVGDGERALVTQFGLAQLLWMPAGIPPGLINPRYGAPELLRGHFTYRCDQYSLALIYAEMRTGVHPLRSHGRCAVETSVAPEPLDLHLLSAAERGVLSRALSDRSHERFLTCTDFVRALQEAAQGSPNNPSGRPALPLLISPPAFPVPDLTADEYLGELRARILGDTQLRSGRRVRYRISPGAGLEHRFAVWPSLEALGSGLDVFCDRWQARFLTRTRTEAVLSISAGAGVWQRLLGRQTGLTVRVRALFPPGSALGELIVLLRPEGVTGSEAVRLLDDLGPAVLDGLRSCLGALPENRLQERVPCNRLVRITPVLPGCQLGEAVEAVGRDISCGGVGFLWKGPLPTMDIYVSLPWLTELAELAVRAQVVRGRARADGWYEVGAVFPTEG